MSLTIRELKEKISQVDKDLKNLGETGGSIQAVSSLTSYREYLEDELKLIYQNKNHGNS
jgi:hypothetical protein